MKNLGVANLLACLAVQGPCEDTESQIYQKYLEKAGGEIQIGIAQTSVTFSHCVKPSYFGKSVDLLVQSLRRPDRSDESIEHNLKLLDAKYENLMQDPSFQLGMLKLLLTDGREHPLGRPPLTHSEILMAFISKKELSKKIMDFHRKRYVGGAVRVVCCTRGTFYNIQG